MRQRVPTNSVVVNPLPNGSPWRVAAAASRRTGLSTAPLPPSFDGELPDASPRSVTMTTAWLANKARTTVARRARSAWSKSPWSPKSPWSKSQEIHPKTNSTLCSLRGSASSAALLSVRRRSSLHAVFVDDSRTAVLKDVVTHRLAR